MKLIDKLVWKELIGPFITGLFMFLMLVFAAGTLFKAADWLVQGVPPLLVLRLVILSLPGVITQTLPMAMLLAGLLSYGRLSADREATAIFASGITFLRSARVVFIMGAVVSLVAFLWNDIVVPPASASFESLKDEALKSISKSDKALSFRKERSDNKGVEMSVEVMGGYDLNRKVLRNVTITKYAVGGKQDRRPEIILYCDEAKPGDQDGLDWVYQNGYIIAVTPDEESGKIEYAIPVTFEELRSNPKAPSLGKNFEEVLRSKVTDPNTKSFNEFRKEIQQRKAKGEIVRGQEVDLYGKISLPIASFIFGIVGAALGITTKRGAGKTVGFGMAIFIVFLYWVFYHSMFVVGKNGGLPPMLASFMADIVGAVAAVLLAMRASR